MSKKSANQEIYLDLWIYKDNQLKKLCKNLNEIVDLQNLILAKYKKKYINEELMTIHKLPQNIEKLSLEKIQEHCKLFLDQMLCETQKNRKDPKVNYVCREALEFIAMREEKSFSTRLEQDDIEQEDNLNMISFQQEDFVDDYMRIMEQRVARQNIGIAEAFMAGEREDVVQLSNNKRNDL